MAGVPLWARVQGFKATAQWAAGPFASTATGALSAVGIGDVILLTTQADTSGSDTSADTVTDSLGNVYRRVSAESGGIQVDTGNTVTKNFWWTIVTVAGTPTITYNCSPSKGFLSIFGDHFTGSSPESVVCVAIGASQVNPGAGVDAILTVSRDTPTEGCLLYAVSSDGGSPTATEAIGSGWLAAQAIDATIAEISEYRVHPSRGPWRATFTDATNGGTHTYLTIAVAVTPARLGDQSGTSPRVGADSTD